MFVASGRSVDLFGKMNVDTDDVNPTDINADDGDCRLTSDAGKANQRFVLIYGLVLIALVLCNDFQ